MGFWVFFFGGLGFRFDDVRKVEVVVFVFFCYYMEVGVEMNVLMNFDDVFFCWWFFFFIVDEGEVGIVLLDGFVWDDIFFVVRDEMESYGDGGEFCSSFGI